eukprot:Awhi_evm2s4703
MDDLTRHINSECAAKKFSITELKLLKSFVDAKLAVAQVLPQMKKSLSKPELDLVEELLKMLSITHYRKTPDTKTNLVTNVKLTLTSLFEDETAKHPTLSMYFNYNPQYGSVFGASYESNHLFEVGDSADIDEDALDSLLERLGLIENKFYKTKIEDLQNLKVSELYQLRKLTTLDPAKSKKKTQLIEDISSFFLSDDFERLKTVHDAYFHERLNNNKLQDIEKIRSVVILFLASLCSEDGFTIKDTIDIPTFCSTVYL